MNLLRRQNYKILIVLILGAIVISGAVLVRRPSKQISISLRSSISKEEVKSAKSRKIEEKQSELITRNLPKLNYSVSIDGDYVLKVDLEIDAIEILQPETYWCGAPFLLDYKGKAQATIINQAGDIVDELELTSPSLVLGTPPDYDYYYYQLHDLDGDGQKSEFLVLKYFSCNGNFVKIVKVVKDRYKFLILPFQLNKETVEEIPVGPNKEDLLVDEGKIRTNSYNVIEGRFYTNTFLYKEGIFTWVESLSP